MDLGIISPIVTVPNGIPVELSQEVSIPKNSNGIRVLFLSRLHQKKGLEFLFEAWAKFIINNPKAVLTIVGSGDRDYVSKLKNNVKKLNISDSVEFIGHVSNPVIVKNYFKESDIFILPSFTENFGMSILESLMWLPSNSIKKYPMGRCHDLSMWMVD